MRFSFFIFLQNKIPPRRVLKDRNDSIITPINRVPSRGLDSIDSNMCSDVSQQFNSSKSFKQPIFDFVPLSFLTIFKYFYLVLLTFTDGA
jgi:hypothetical protein